MSLTRSQSKQKSGDVTLSVSGLSLGSVLQTLAIDYNVSTVTYEGLEDKPVTAELVNVSVESAIEHLAKRVGADVRLSGGVYYLGQLSSSDRGVLVRRVRRLDSDQLKEALQTILSESGRSATFDDGLCVVTDSVGVLDRVSTLFDQVESNQTPGWVVQLEVVSYSRAAAERFEIDLTPAGRVAASVGLDGSDIEFVAQVNAFLDAVRSDSDVELVADPVLFVADGKTATYSRLEKIPYRSEAIQVVDGAAIRSTDIEFLEVGFSLDCSLRETASQKAAIDVTLSNSNVTAAAADLPPTVGSDEFTSSVPISAGGVYLIASFESSSLERGQSLGFRRGVGWESVDRVFQVWLRAYEINEPAASGDRERSEASTPSTHDADTWEAPITANLPEMDD